MTSSRTARRGFTLIEIMLGLSVLLFTLACSAAWMSTVTKNMIQSSMASKMDQKLRSVAESIRYEANATFDGMQEGVSDRTGSGPGAMYPSIRVTANIGPIDLQTRTRHVTLTANWKQAGHADKVQTLVFDVGRVQTVFSGAQAKVKAVEKETGSGIPNVTVVGPGQDVSEVSCVTDNTGACTLYGVQIANAGINLTFDGIKARHFFSPPDTIAHSFVRTVSFPPTRAGELNDFTSTPVEMNSPGIITGVVRDPSGAGVPDAEVYLVKEAGTLLIDMSLGGSDRKQLTKADGSYLFTGVIPGNYFVYLLGNKLYAAVAVPDDYYNGGARWKQFRVTVSTGATRNFTTVKKGAISGTIFGASQVGANFTKQAAAGAGVEARFFTTQSRVYYGGAPYDFSNTTVWKEFLAPVALTSATATTDASGNFSTDRTDLFTPLIVNEDFPRQDQYNKVVFSPGRNMPAPFTPVALAAIGQKPLNTKFLAVDTIGRQYFYPAEAPYTADVSMFERPIYTGDLNRSENRNHEMYFLDRSQLAKPSGALFKVGQPGVFYPRIDTDPPTHRYVVYNDRYHSGAVHYGADDTTTFTQYTFIDSTIDPGGFHRYHFTKAGSGWELLPTLGGDQSELEFNDRSFENSSVNRKLKGSVRGFEKKLVGSAITYQEIPTASINTSIPIEGVWNGGPPGTPASWTQNAVTVAAGNWSIASQPQLIFTSYGEGKGTAVLAAGSSPNLPIYVTAFTTDFAIQTAVRAGQNSQWVYDWDSTASIWQGLGPVLRFDGTWYRNQDTPVESITIVKVGQTGKIYGKVRDYAGRPLTGARVTLQRSSGRGAAPLPPLYYTTEANACPSCGAYDYQFVFNVADFVMIPTANLWLKVEMGGYKTGEESCEAYDGFTRRWDFQLFPNDLGDLANPNL